MENYKKKISQLLTEVLNVDEEEAKRLIFNLKSSYENENRGIRISYLGDAFKLTTKPEHKEFYQKLVETPESNTLSPVALETLAIIAYNGPLTRLEIDEMRGVSTSYTLRKLLARDLIKVCGKSDLPGKPNLYTITNTFLDYFGLATLNDLPKFESLAHEDEEELYTTIFKENE